MGENSENAEISAEKAAVSKDDERVLVVPTRLFREFGAFQGFSRSAAERCAGLFSSNELRFLRRGDAERDPNFKQLIPYVIFVATDANGRASVFVYRRGDGQGEKRLRAKRSAGIGGHINDGDEFSANADLFDAGTRREIAEEVVLGAEIVSFERVGLVNDDSTEVGTVHLGVVCLAELAAPALTSNEPDLLEAGFRVVDELLAEIDAEPEAFETWTILALKGLFGAKK